MPAVVVAFAAEEIYAAFAEYAAFELEAGAIGSALIGGTAAVIAAQVTARALGLNDVPQLRPTTPAGAMVDATGTYAGIPIIYGSRRIGGVRVLTEMASTFTGRASEVYPIPAGLTVTVAKAAGFVTDIGVFSDTRDANGNLIRVAFVQVGSSPGPGQYTVNLGIYTFNAADRVTYAGRNLTFIYNYGETNNRLHMIVVWSMGEIASIDQIYLDDVAITDTRFAGLVYYENYTGADTQAASTSLISALQGKWTASHQLRGLAYSYVRLDWDEKAFPHGKPNITADVHGRKVFDPRSGLTAFSNNPWICIRDYLTSTRYGWKAPGSSIDDATFIAEANYADQAVAVPTASGTTTQARYACDGIVDIDRGRLDNMRALLSSCRGFLVFSGGLYKAKSEAVSSPVSLTLNENNIVGGWGIQLPQRRGRYNRMRANFFDAQNLWQSVAAVEDSTVYRATDGGTVFEATLDLPFTGNIYRAHQLAMMALKQSRFGIGVTLRATIAALQLEVGDVVPITHTMPGWVAQLFRVASIQLLSSDEIGVSLTQYDPSVYTLDALSYVNPDPATNLPDLGRVYAPGAPMIVETLYSTIDSAGVKSRASVSWMESPDVFVRFGGYYQLEVSPAGANNWRIYPHIHALVQDVNDVAPGTYDFRVTAFNSAGVQSPYALTTKELIGLSAPPSDVANFAVQSYSGQAKFTWKKFTNLADLDVTIGGRVFVRWSPKTAGAVWNDGTLVNSDGYPGDTSIGFGPLTTGTYMAKAMDSSGNFSVNAASFIVTEALLTALTAIATVTESPSFAGAKTNVANTGGAIQLDGTTLIDDMVALIDSWGLIDSLGGAKATGSYAFASKLDLGSVQPSRLLATIDSSAFSNDDLMDSRVNNIDDWTSMDGAVIEDAEVQLMVRSTNDDPNGAPVWGPWHALGQVGDYNARGFDFRLDFATANSTHNRAVSTLSVAAKH